MAWSHWAIDRGSRGSRGSRRKMTIAGVADLLSGGRGGFSGDFRDCRRLAATEKPFAEVAESRDHCDCSR